MILRRAWRRALPALVGLSSILVIWELVALIFFRHSQTVPTPTAVARGLWDERQFYPANVVPTVAAAGKGYIFGNGLAVLMATATVVAPFTEKFLLRIAVVAYSLPLIALAPILVVVFNGDTPEVVLAALSVFFTTLIGIHLGLHSADKSSLDVVRAYGGGRLMELTKVRAWSCLPSFFAALRIAAPSALLGAIIGEFLGADRGLGVALVASQQAFNGVRTWGIAIVCAGIAGGGYLVTSLLARLLVPWAQSAGRPQ